MALSAEKVLMIGVGILGAAFVYKLLTAPKNQNPEPALPGPTPKILPPAAPLPTSAGTIGALPAGLPGPAANGGPAVVSTPTLHLINSRAYRGRVELPAGTTSKDPGPVLGLLQSIGFDPGAVQVFASPEETAGNIPDFALQNPGQGTRWFHARYLGATKDVPRPPSLVAMWIVSSAPVRTLAINPQASPLFNAL
jgi:hypothetical protein